MTLLARLGDKDGASAIAEKYVERINLDTWASGPPFLFVSQTAALRQDPAIHVSRGPTGPCR